MVVVVVVMVVIGRAGEDVGVSGDGVRCSVFGV